MTNKSIKIIVDVLMLVAVVLSFVRWNGLPTFHTITGAAFALFFVIHFCLNKKVFIAYCKSINKLKGSVKFKWLVDVFMIVVWSIVIVTGVIALFSYLEITDITFNIGKFHGILARVGAVLIAIHIIQHGKQIALYFKIKRKRG